VVGVLLSGTLDDGTDGLRVIKQCGGLAVVQQPEDAIFGDMPANAMQLVSVDHVEPAAKLGALLVTIVSEIVVPERAVLLPVLIGSADHPTDVAVPERGKPHAILRPPGPGRRSG